MFEKFSPEILSLILSSVMAIDRALEKINFSDKKKLTKRIRQFHSQLQALINDAERIFSLIQNADEQIKDYGESQFAKIVQDKLETQADRIKELIEKILDSDMSLILENIDENIRVQLSRAIGFKRDGIFIALAEMKYSKLKIDSGQLFVVRDKKKIPAFPDIDKQLNVLLKLKKCSKSLWETISSQISIKDLKD